MINRCPVVFHFNASSRYWNQNTICWPCHYYRDVLLNLGQCSVIVVVYEQEEIICSKNNFLFLLSGFYCVMAPYDKLGVFETFVWARLVDILHLIDAVFTLSQLEVVLLIWDLIQSDQDISIKSYKYKLKVVYYI